MPSIDNSPKLRRIQWVGSEWDKLAKEVINLKPSLINSDTLLDMDRATFLKAQQVLPQDRQRNPAGIPTVQIVRPRLAEAIKKLRKEVQAQEVAKAAKEAQDAQEAALVSPPPPALDPSYAPLVEAVAVRVTELMQDQIKHLLSQLIPNLPELAFKALPIESRKSKPKFVILGGNPNQHNDIMRSFPNVDFSFMVNDDKHNTVDRAASADYIIAMTDFIRHGLDGKMKKAYPEKYKPTTGNVSAVKRLIGLLLNHVQHVRAANLH
jgi:hypothetical protein